MQQELAEREDKQQQRRGELGRLDTQIDKLNEEISDKEEELKEREPGKDDDQRTLTRKRVVGNSIKESIGAQWAAVEQEREELAKTPL
jgi:uncharacterized protein (DUF3084 family)